MNILLLIADEFRRDAAGFSGNHSAVTPCLDALAAGARVFTRAYTPSPVCVPARQCLATGRNARSLGLHDFHGDIEPGSCTFAKWFAEHGYYTVACGKLHHRGPDQMQGWLHRIGSETAQRWPAAFANRNQIGRSRWRGRDSVLDAGPGESPLAIHDEFTVRGACDFLRMHFGGHYDLPADTPLMLMVSLQQPHFPLRCDPDLFNAHLPRVALPSRRDPPSHPVLAKSALTIADADVLKARAAYAALVQATDRRFSEVLRTLRECGQNPDEWLIVFTSDHGDLLGDHGCWEKRSFLEESVGVPLFLRGPGVTSGSDDRLTSLIDLFPSLCDLAGLEKPAGLDGRSVSCPSSSVVSQLGAHHFMIRSERWKYMNFGADGPEVLFDMVSDPRETVNRIDEIGVADVVTDLRRQLPELTGESPLR